MPDYLIAFGLLALAFILILWCIRRFKSLSFGMACGGAALGIMTRLTAKEWLFAAKSTLSDPKTLSLAGIVTAILILSDSLEKTGQSGRLMRAISAYLTSRRWKLAFFPALIGLLPMPGGAVFSAPMVDAAADGAVIRPEDKTLINYWFRHIWELVWPLYPGNILAASLIGVPLLTLLAVDSVGLLAAVVLGWFFFLRPKILPLSPPDSLSPLDPRSAALLIRASLPLVIALAGSLCLEILFHAFFPDIPPEMGILLGLAAAIGCVALQNRLSPLRFASLLRLRHLSSMALLVLSIFWFKAVIDVSGLTETLAKTAGSGAGLAVVLVGLPFMVGMVTGITVAFVGSTFPFILAMLGQIPPDHALPYMVVAMFAGFTGVLLSPVHACLLLTCHFFATSLSKAWRRLAPPSLLFLTCGVLYVSAWLWLFPG